ncbi:hypothetical protein SAMN02745119_01511 [Trichlorobacter thiogenes]|uniref:Uncharacterized protein n=1 Tax=Trichlorobacter thiogenes TaxID=115783 RepID=A0A1T4N4N3_9BACT|nr:hypothetical protein [Trichlorobacter thiogenes]SJZ74027.1 hypothetical protein SAMN02745119_01511 [Trichlorobacter thiogenes]
MGTTVDNMALLSRNGHQPSSVSPLRVVVVDDAVLSGPADGQVLSWRPLLLEIRIQENELDYLNRVANCQAKRACGAGVAWASGQIVDHCDGLINEIIHGMMDAHTKQAVRLDRLFMLVAIVGLVMIPFNPMVGMTFVMLCMLIGWIVWLVAQQRNRKLATLLIQLDDTHDARVDLICLLHIRQDVLRGGVQ